MNSADILAEAQSAIRDGLALVSGASAHACFTCSFQAEDMVVLHLIRQVAPTIDVLFLETGYHFTETYAYRDRMAREWRLNLVNLAPPITVAAQEAAFGILYATDPGRCCQIRKVEPLMAGLENYQVWFTGLRREQSPTRAALRIEEEHRAPSGKVLRKISPLAGWTNRDVLAYTTVNEIPLLPLYEQGYSSIGCQPCTRLPDDPSNPRSGRWGSHKLECGIHTFTEKQQQPEG
jgi:phosphoadenosine phosphosulfate reductase